jgi:hypothetical protein
VTIKIVRKHISLYLTTRVALFYHRTTHFLSSMFSLLARRAILGTVRIPTSRLYLNTAIVSPILAKRSFTTSQRASLAQVKPVPSVKTKTASNTTKKAATGKDAVRKTAAKKTAAKSKPTRKVKAKKVAPKPQSIC